MNTIRRLHIDLLQRTVGVEFERGGISARDVIAFDDLEDFDLVKKVETLIQAKLDRNVKDVSDGNPKKLTSHLHALRTARAEDAQLKQGIRLSTQRLGHLKRQIAAQEAAKK